MEKEKFNDIFDMTMNRLGIPKDPEKATVLQVVQMHMLKEFNEVIAEYSLIASVAGGSESTVFETLRAQMDITELMISELKRGTK